MPDLAFGDKGYKILDIDQDDHVSKVLVDARGAIYYFGQTAHYGDTTDLDYIIGKLTPAGEIDPHFGVDGLMRGDFGRFRNSRIVHADIQGNALYFIGEGNNAGAQDTQQVFIGKLDLDGNWDASFADWGLFTRRFLGEYASAGSLKVLADGRIVYCGMTTDTLAWHIEEPLFGRLLPDGRPDSTLRGSGCIAWSLAHGLASLRSIHNDGGKLETILPMGNGYLLGGVFYTSSYGKALLMRITEDGELDDGFGENGMLRPDISPGFTCVVTHACQAGSDIYLGATLDVYQGGEDFALLRMDTLGTTLDYQGIDFQDHEDRLQDMLLDSQGKLLLAGYARKSGASPLAPESDGFALAGMHGWDSMLPSFGDAGKCLFNMDGRSGAGAKALCETTDRRLLVAGFVGGNTPENFSDILLMKLLLDSVVVAEVRSTLPSEALVYPNPAQGRLFLRSDIAEATLMDLQGRVVLVAKADAAGIDVSALAAGVYVVEVGGVWVRWVKL